MVDPQNSKQEQSMEEILQSIKRIIADDEIDQSAPVQKFETMKITGIESDVLELTELVEEGDKQVQPTQDILQTIDERLENFAPAIQDKATQNDDILANIDELISAEAAQATANALNNFKQAQTTKAPAQMPAPSLSLRSGVTIEDLVIEALKPELRNWLNNNLSNIVERMVAAEIKKIAGN